MTKKKKSKEDSVPLFLIKFTLIGLFLLALILLAYYKFGPQWKRPYPSLRNRYATKGIDIARYAGKVDWDKVADQGYGFVYMKATEGTSLTDPNYSSYYQKAKQAGLRVGAYHFFRFDQAGSDQAQNFLSTALIDTTDMPLVIDVEEYTNYEVNETQAQEVRAVLTEMIAIVESRVGRKVMLYTNKNGYERIIAGFFKDNPIWICDISGSRPSLSDGREWTMWQYSHNARIKGVQGNVDLNVVQNFANLTH
jgi:lysozyme